MKKEINIMAHSYRTHTMQTSYFYKYVYNN